MNDSNGCNIRRKRLSRPISSVEDCAVESIVDHWELRELAQLRPAAAGLERSAAHPANEVGSSKNAGAQHRPCQNIVEPAPGMDARRAETIVLKEIKVKSDGFGSRQPGPRGGGVLHNFSWMLTSLSKMCIP
jgi:hypothetical protein